MMHGHLGTPVARNTDPQTSHDAARRIAGKAGSWRRQALEALLFSPWTDDELCRFCMVPDRYWPSMKTARSALKNAGLVVDTGEVRDGQTVWRALSPSEVLERSRQYQAPDDTQGVLW